MLLIQPLKGVYDCRVWQLSRTWRIVPKVTVAVKSGAELPQLLLKRSLEFALVVPGHFGECLAFSFALHGSWGLVASGVPVVRSRVFNEWNTATTTQDGL
jgi:hypothetical protein